MITLRPYQADCVNAWVDALTFKKCTPVVAVPTGGGKSYILCGLIEEYTKLHRDANILILSHTQDIIQQDYDSLLDFFPKAFVGIYSAGLNKKQIRKITVGGIQSVWRRPDKFQHFDLIVVDEVHTVGHKADGMYRKFFELVKAKITGMSATVFRTGHGLIYEDNELFDYLAYDLTGVDNFNQLVVEGHLTKLISKRTEMGMDVRRVKKTGGDYQVKDLSKKFNKEAITATALEETIRYGKNYKKWLVFAIDIGHADAICKQLNKEGIKSDVLHSRMEKGRVLVTNEFKTGDTRCIVSVGMVTTGFDAPCVDLIVLLRPTMSAVLHVQMVGRGLRVAEGKDHCISSGARVLTDTGLVPIEKVTTDQKVWDGIDFVSHGGVVYKGEQEVITYAGLTATEDHRVWTKQGWRSFGECALEQAAISVTGVGRYGKFLSDSYFRQGIQKRKSKQSACKYILHYLRDYRIKGFNFCKERYSRMQKVWKKKKYRQTCTRGPSLDNSEMCGSKAKMHEPKRQEIRRLWRPWYKVLFRLSFLNGGLCYESWTIREDQTPTNRQRKQRWTLRRRELTISNSFREQAQSKTEDVWDIVNAGPRNRFTCEGLLVSNCLVLDFAGNTKRLGPINDVLIPKKGGKGTGEAPVKTCSECGVMHHISARVCSVCGEVFPIKSKLEKKASQVDIVKKEATPKVRDIRWLDIRGVQYTIHSKLGKPDSMLVVYHCAINIIKEWICLDHAGYAKRKADHWATFRGYKGALNTTDVFLAAKTLAKPKQIQVDFTDKYTSILDARF